MPVRINAPGLFWNWPGIKWEGDEDRIIRIFGKNLKMPDCKRPLDRDKLVL